MPPFVDDSDAPIPPPAVVESAVEALSRHVRNLEARLDAQGEFVMQFLLRMETVDRRLDVLERDVQTLERKAEDADLYGGIVEGP